MIMNMYMLPTDEAFIEEIAKAIAKNRILSEVGSDVNDMITFIPEVADKVEGILDDVFDNIWAGMGEQDVKQKDLYREDAKAAISAINLKLLTLSP